MSSRQAVPDIPSRESSSVASSDSSVAIFEICAASSEVVRDLEGPRIIAARDHRRRALRVFMQRALAKDIADKETAPQTQHYSSGHRRRIVAVLRCDTNEVVDKQQLCPLDRCIRTLVRSDSANTLLPAQMFSCSQASGLAP